MNHLAVQVEPGTVAWAIPSAVGLVPTYYTPHMRADGGDGMNTALLVFEGADVLTVYFND